MSIVDDIIHVRFNYYKFDKELTQLDDSFAYMDLQENTKAPESKPKAFIDLKDSIRKYNILLNKTLT